jgi:hypothetical protein
MTPRLVGLRQPAIWTERSRTGFAGRSFQQADKLSCNAVGIAFDLAPLSRFVPGCCHLRQRFNGRCDGFARSSSGLPKSNRVGASEFPDWKRIDPHQRRRRDRNIGMRDPKIIGHIDSSDEECIIVINCIGWRWQVDRLLASSGRSICDDSIP